jgi:hypothetical protein
MAALAGKKALVKISGTATAMTAEATTTTDDQNYQITDTAKRILPLDATIVVDDNGTPTVESYTLNRLNGTVTFARPNHGRWRIFSHDYSNRGQ